MRSGKSNPPMASLTFHAVLPRCMKPAWWLIFSVMLCFLPGLHAQTLDGYAIQIEGAGELTDLLNEHLQIGRHTDNEEVTLPELQRLVDITPRQVRQLLSTEGYFSPVVQRSLVQEDGRWIARFQITPGPRTVVEKVTLNFRGPIASEAQDERRMNLMRRRWELPAGEPFRQKDWDSAKNALLAELLVRNYPAAKIAASQARIDPERNTAELTVDIDSGPAFTFGELKIEGLERYSPAVIDTINPIKPGDPFTQDKLNELQARLQDTGYFRSVFATIEPDPAYPNRVPILVTVNEYEQKQLSLGIGFSTDSGPRVQARWLNRNLNQRNWRLESDVLLDRNTRSAGSELFFQPLDIGWRPSVAVNYERREITGEITDRLRAGARLNRILTRSEQSWSLMYYSDRQSIGETLRNNREALLLNYSYLRRRVDNTLAPRRGNVSSIELGAGPAGLVNENHIVRVLAQTNWFIPLAPRWTGVLRAQVGQVSGAGRETVPSDLLFRTGGDQSVRGYAFNTLGVEESGAIVGGTVLGVASAEVIYHFTPAWGVAVFTDAGDAADSWSDFQFKHGSGVGVRRRSPVGPVNLDAARAQESGNWRLHFSIGYGF